MSKKKKKKHPEKKEEAPARQAADAPKQRDANVKTALVWMITASAAFLVVAGLVAFTIFGYARLYENRIFPGVRILGVRLDGLTADEARGRLHEAIDAALKDGLRFRYEGRDITLDASTFATENPDASRDLILYGIDEPVNAALSYGRGDSLVKDTLLRWKARVKPAEIEANVTIDEQGVRDGILRATEDQVTPVKNARLEVTWNADANRAETTVHDAEDGEELRLEIALAKLREQSASLDFEPIELTGETSRPDITKEDIEPLLPEVPTWMAYAPFTLTYDNANFEISKMRFASWLGVIQKDGEARLTIDPDVFRADIREITDIEQVAKKGTFVIKDGHITSFEAGSIGYAIDDRATLDAMLPSLGASSTFDIVVNREEASLSGDDPDRLGIREIIGIGRSNFAGSPANRRKNIALGVQKVNGSLIAPGEEFSLLKTLGPVTAENGWLAELVIKGNKTTPEYGGGLCQIGTTMFRAAVHSGMKITERRNHSYRVSYYEPAGTDATIYEPSPDMRFINDTAHHILIHAYIVGTEVVYEFWGTNDGRTVTVGAPRIYNITAAPPTKLIETLDLEPGKKKCTESAHAGADAAFDYNIEYADGTVHEETFYSHYRPWQAVCLVGVESLSEDSEGDETPVEEEAPAEEQAP